MKRYATFLPILLAALMFYFTAPMPFSPLKAYPMQEDTAGGGDEGLFDSTLTGTKADTGAMKTLGADGSQKKCDDIPEAKGGVLLGRIVPCLIYTIQNTTTSFSQKMIEMLRPMVYSFFTLVIVFFGVKILQGEQQLGAQSFSLVIKLAFVVGIMELIPGTIVPAAYGIMKDGVSITATAFGPDAMSISCNIDKFGGSETPLIWKQMDCMLGKLFGVATGEATVAGGTEVNMLLGASAIGLLMGFFFGGTLGVTVFFALIGVLWTVMMLILRIALAFLNGYLIVCILLIIAPLFLPLVLMKVTQEYFEKWWKAILGGLMLPIIISAFSMFALYAYDKILFQPGSELQKLFDYAEVKEAMQLSEHSCDLNITGNTKSKSNKKDPTKEEMDALMKSPFLSNFAQPLLSGASDACSMLDKPVFDITKVKSFEDSKKSKTELLTNIFKQCIKLLIMAFLIAEGVETVQNVISSFTGSSLAREAMTARSQLETSFKTSFENLKGSLSRGLSVEGADGRMHGATGADFKDKFPTAVRSSMTDFMSSLVNKR